MCCNRLAWLQWSMHEMSIIEAWEDYFSVGWHDQSQIHTEFCKEWNVLSYDTAHSQIHTEFSAQLLTTKGEKRAETKRNNR